MSFVTKLTAGLLSFGTLMAGILPVMARPATLDATSNLRSDTSITSSMLELLPKGSNVEVLNIRIGNDGNYWYYIQPDVEGSQNGWVRSDLVRFQTSDKRYATLGGSRRDKINVRSGPNLNSKVLHHGLSGDLVTIEDSYQQYGKQSWYRVKFASNATGWIREDLLSIWEKGCIITCPEH
jgi:uncharacterized protein YgiM (DUF1202 family)